MNYKFSSRAVYTFDIYGRKRLIAEVAEEFTWVVMEHIPIQSLDHHMFAWVETCREKIPLGPLKLMGDPDAERESSKLSDVFRRRIIDSTLRYTRTCCRYTGEPNNITVVWKLFRDLYFGESADGCTFLEIPENMWIKIHLPEVWKDFHDGIKDRNLNLVNYVLTA